MRGAAPLRAAAERAWRWARDPVRSQRVLGLSFVVVVVVIWVGSSFLVQGIERGGASPVVLTFVANSLFAVFLPIYFISLRVRRKIRGASEHELDSLVPSGTPPSDLDAHAAGAAAESSKLETHAQLPWRPLVKAALLVRLILLRFPSSPRHLSGSARGRRALPLLWQREP